MKSSIRGAVLARLEKECARIESAANSFAQYHDDPSGFFRDVLGVELWSKQEEIAQALAADDRVSVASGNGVGKTFLAAGLVWWFVKTRGENSRVFLTSAKGEHSENAIWREVRQHFFRAARRGRPLGGTMPKLGKTGWDGSDSEQILIVTADQAESFQGLRAPKMMIVADEASGIEERIFEAMHANLSAEGSKWLLIGNPMKSTGYFFESHKEDSGWSRFVISVLESPNVIAGRTVIEGLPARTFVEELKRKYGEDSPIYKIRVLGQFIVNEAGKPIPWVFIEDAQKRWDSTTGQGVLCVGVDPAGPGQFGDQTAIVWTRGSKMLGFLMGTWDEDAIIRHVLDVVREHRAGDECPRVILDAGGPIGGPLFTRLRGIARSLTPQKRMLVFGVRASDKAKREPQNYTTTRDELFENLARWIKAEGAIPPHVGLAEELHAPMWHGFGRGLLKLTSKDEVRKLLGRSPDLADALALSVWALSDDETVDPTARTQQVAPPPPSNIYAQNARDSRGVYGSLDWMNPNAQQRR